MLAYNTSESGWYMCIWWLYNRSIFFTLEFFHNVSMDFKLNNFQSLNKITLICFSFVNVFILLPNAKMIFSYINHFKIKSFNSDSLIHVKLWLDSFILYTRDICHISAATGNKSDTLDEKLLITFVLLWFIEFFLCSFSSETNNNIINVLSKSRLKQLQIGLHFL